MIPFQAQIFPSQGQFEDFIKTHKGSHFDVKDLIDAQLLELTKIRFPSAREVEITNHMFQLRQEFGDNYGTYIYYPWSNKCIRILNKKEFVELRTSRNLYKITKEEQVSLSAKNIVVIGQSVGKAIAQVMALERICGKLTLVDFDVLETSNMNRIMTSLVNVNEFKAVICAREIAELDPYLDLQVFVEGVNPKNMLQVIGKRDQTDLVIEVCDNLEMKINIRNFCKEKQIPLLMDTSDRGMVDVERYDKEPNRSIFHGNLEELDLDNLNYEDLDTKMKLLTKIVDIEKASDRAKQSLSEIGKSIRTWPQLGSSVYLGAAATTFAARKILLEENMESGRYYIDLEELFNCN